MLQGAVASQYGNLVHRLWRGKMSVHAPRALRDTVVRHASQFAGFEQHDSQEFLNYLLDALHEDVNRVRNPPYVERKDSAGRPDHIVAAESWHAHELRNRSIIVDLFQGQLKSTLRCKTCRFESISFDPFTFLQLPLPSEAETVLDVRVVRRAADGLAAAVPEMCAVHVAQDGTVAAVVPKVTDMYGLDPRAVAVVEFPGTPAQRVVCPGDKIRALKGNILNVYELAVDAHGAAAAEAADPSADDTAPSLAVPPADGASPSDAPSPAPPVPPVPPVPLAADTVPSSPAVLKRPQQYHVSGHIFAIHRKRESHEYHFLTQPTKVGMFGHPLLIPCPVEGTTAALYAAVWASVKRCCRPDFRHQVDTGDEALPFTLTQLRRSGTACHPSKCAWGRFCTGCVHVLLPRGGVPCGGVSRVSVSCALSAKVSA